MDNRKVVVGSGDYAISAVLVRRLSGQTVISENSVSYWIDHAYLGMDLVIFKESVSGRGRELAGLLKESATDGYLEDWLAGAVLTHATASQLKTAIVEEMRRAFERGAAAKLTEIREALGLEDA